MTFTIRPITVDDAADINRLRTAPGCFENTLGLPSERVEYNREFIECLGSNDHQFVAVVTDSHGLETVIGTASLCVFGNPRMRHAASLGIIVDAPYQGQGVGRALMEKLLDLADNWLMLKRVELGVYPDNDCAIALYESLGFVREGVKRMTAVRNGQYVDEIMMARIKE